MTVSLSRTASFLIWFTLLWILVGPPVRIPMLPSEIQVHDLSIVLLIPVFLAILARGVNLEKLVSVPFLFFSCYVGLILLMPLIGIAFIPQASFSMYLGDLRWFYILILIVAACAVYQRLGVEVFERHLVFSLIVAISVAWLVLLPQVYMQITRASAPTIIGIWYPEGRSGPSYGFHIFRFAGPFGQISALSTFGVVLYAAGLFTGRRGLANTYIIISGLIFALASGGRTGFVALLLLTIIFIVVSLFRGRISFRGMVFFLSTVAAAAALLLVAVNFNLGRVDGGRVQSILLVMAGGATLYDVAGRGGYRWSAPFEAAQQWSQFGTLVNSSHALDLLAFDNYYIYLWAQAGPIILIPFAATIIFSLIMSWRNYIRDPSFQNSLALVVVVVLPIFSFTQNTMTGLLGRALLGIAMTVLVLNRENRHSTSTRPLSGRALTGKEA